MGNISRTHKMRHFDVWRIDFIGHFPHSYNNLYIVIATNYVCKWMETIATPINDSKVVIKFLKKDIFTIFATRFGT